MKDVFNLDWYTYLVILYAVMHVYPHLSLKQIK